MKSFEEVMRLTRTVSSATTLDDVEARALYDACLAVPSGGLVVEVGCQLGRSSSLIAQMACDRQFFSIHIDPFTDQPDFLRQWHQMMWQIRGRDHAYTHLCMRTRQAYYILDSLGEAKGAQQFDLVYIDGDHEYPGVMVDLRILCPLIPHGGRLLMHDYERDTLPGVKQAANEYLSNPAWLHLGVHGTMGVWRRM